MQTVTDSSDAYTIRRFSSADIQGYLDLLETVWGHCKSTEWFRWRFRDNPYLAETPCVVATRDGTVVGIESCLAFRLRIGTRRVLAVQPADWAVHPAHRGRGLCTRMTERLLDVVADGPAELYFNFPSEALMPCLEQFDWEFTAAPRRWVRIQNPAAFTAQFTDGRRPLVATLVESLGRLGTPLNSLYLGYRDRVAGRESPGLIERSETIPVDELVELYERTAPEQIHVVRDRAFYRWRFENPRWEPTTYLARRDGHLIAACLVCTESVGGVVKTRIVDVLPKDRSAPEQVLRALLTAVVADAADSDNLEVNSAGFPPRLLDAFGFWPTDALPLSLVSTTTPMAVRPVSLDGPEPWLIDGVDVTEQGAWALSLAAQDVG